jgi:hypothetical protein
MTRWLIVVAAVIQLAGDGGARDLTLSGRVVDEWGAPIAGAEVMVCADVDPCGFAFHHGVASPGSIASLARTATRPSWSADSYAVVATRSDGTWTARIALIRTSGFGGNDVHAVVTAPHREMVEHRTNEGAPRPLGADIRLRPASTLDVDPQCNRGPCTGPIDVGVSPHRPYPGRHLERLAPGGYRVLVRENRNEPGERRGTAVIETTYTPRALRIPVALQLAGTGKSIRGTVKLGGAASIGVVARCFGPLLGGRPIDEPVYRSTRTDASGGFELRDVGPPPCVVELSGYPVGRSAYSDAHVKVDSLPATGIALP